MMFYFRYVFYLAIFVCFSSSHAGAYEDFFQAVLRDDGHAVAGLLARGFDVNSRDERGQTALHLALRDNSPGVAEALWKSPSLDLNALNADDETAMMMAALRGQTAWVRRFLDRGAKVHKTGWSPIHYAATGPAADAVALLLDRGAPIDAESPNRTTPLMMAARYGTEASVDLLLARGADAKRKNDLKLDAADFARQSGRDFLVERIQRAAKR
ncbi:MAG: ankyrin repeat domain-containing protein [Aquincola sp.]|nr:ankyrin repeat domain-containing protein [Aquincola sp.]